MRCRLKNNCKFLEGNDRTKIKKFNVGIISLKRQERYVTTGEGLRFSLTFSEADDAGATAGSKQASAGQD